MIGGFSSHLPTHSREVTARDRDTWGTRTRLSVTDYMGFAHAAKPTWENKANGGSSGSLMQTQCHNNQTYYLKGAAAPPAAGPFNSTLHTGDPILGLNVFLFCFIVLLGVQWFPVASLIYSKCYEHSAWPADWQGFIAYLCAWFDLFSC